MRNGGAYEHQYQDGPKRESQFFAYRKFHLSPLAVVGFAERQRAELLFLHALDMTVRGLACFFRVQHVQ